MTEQEYKDKCVALQPYLYNANQEKKAFHIKGANRKFKSTTLFQGEFILYFEATSSELTAKTVAVSVTLEEFLSATSISL